VANIAQMVNVLQAIIFTDKEKMVLTPTYHVFHMYVPFHGATLVPVDFASGSYKFGDIELPRVDAIAARDSAGKLWMALTNLDPRRGANVELDVQGASVSRAVGQTLVAPKIDSVNTFEAPNTVAPKPFASKVAGRKLPVKLPPASITVIGLD
jgi:alpha-N-arabinofuranosidase